MKLILTLALLSTVLHAQAQMLLVEPGPEDPELLRFNPAFIVRNGVKIVEGQLWTKRDGQPMKSMDRYYQYRFSTDGLMKRTTNVLGRASTGLDTASVMFSYNTNGQLLEEVHGDQHGFFALQTEYGPEGRPVRATHVRLGNLTASLEGSGADTPTVVSDERYTYTNVSDTVWRKTYLNDRGRPYQEQTFTKDRLGYLRHVETLNLITQRRGTTTFSYDGNGRLAVRTAQADLGRPEITTWKWTYDAAGDPITLDLERNSQLVRHSEYLYADGTLFLKAIITRIEETGLIEILRFETTR
jgi:hypothetical protein